MARVLIFLALLAAVAAGTARADQPLVSTTGTFTSSDQLLNQIYTDSVKTATDVVSPPVNLWPEGCHVPNELLILDGVVRDRCVYPADISVSGLTLLLAGATPNPFRNMILLFANDQLPSGAIPASACLCTDPLFDLSAYWIYALYNDVLFGGDTATLAQVWPNVKAVLNQWYPSVTQGGLVANPYGPSDYGYIERQSQFVGYYNAEYVWILQLASKLAQWNGDAADASAWTVRAQSFAANTLATFWDASAGAFKDTPTGTVVHGQDDNVFAVLAGLGTSAQRTSALAYLDKYEYYPYGNSIADNNTWDSAVWGNLASMRVYPFMSYFALLADFQEGRDSAAFSLLRREWGYMVKNGPGTMWETIGPYGGPPPGGSWDHGWSSGAAPVLAEYVLGVQPTSPGFATFTVTPHVDDLTSATGTVATPHGAIQVSWKLGDHGLVLHVIAPPGTSWTNPPAAVTKKPAKPAGKRR